MLLLVVDISYWPSPIHLTASRWHRMDVLNIALVR